MANKNNENNWTEYRRLVLAELKRLNDELEILEEKVNQGNANYLLLDERLGNIKDEVGQIIEKLEIIEKANQKRDLNLAKLAGKLTIVVAIGAFILKEFGLKFLQDLFK